MRSMEDIMYIVIGELISQTHLEYFSIIFISGMYLFFHWPSKDYALIALGRKNDLPDHP